MESLVSSLVNQIGGPCPSLVGRDIADSGVLVFGVVPVDEVGVPGSGKLK